MAIGYAHTVFCDRRGCRAKVTVADTRNADHARRAAHRTHGWRCDAAGDFCPAERTAPRGQTRNETTSRTAATASRAKGEL